MSDKTRFMFLIRPSEREALKRLAEAFDRSEGATLRLLIRNASRLGLITPLILDQKISNPCPEAKVESHPTAA